MAKAKVLIVEDYDAIRDVYATVFAAEDFKVETATSGEEALSKTEQMDFDLILLDILMLEMDGIDFLREFKVAERENPPKIVIISNINSEANPNIVKRAKDLGAEHYLTKSKYTPKDIVTVAKQTLEIG